MDTTAHSLPEQNGVVAAADAAPTIALDPTTRVCLVAARRFGDYELVEEIARGGMGVVYRARQISLNRSVALKMILAGQLASEADIKRLRSEAEAAANLDHPGIVPVFEVGQHDGQHYFTMGYVRGHSLQARLAEGPLPPREAARLVFAVAEAVEYAHQQGVIHRDLKPGNILIDEHGQPRVTDFGLAKRVAHESGLTATGQILGTPSYMPPEQAAGQAANGVTADVYALGAVLYALLVGRPPFQAAGPAETLLQVLQREPIPPRRLNPDVPVDLNTIVLKCLEKNPALRYATAQQLADELRRYLHDEPILARPIGRGERVWRWCKRQPKVAALGAGVVALLLFVLIAAPLVTAHQTYLRGVAETNARRAQRETTRANREARQAQAALHQARLNELRAVRAAPTPGWSRTCAENLRRNAEQDIPERDFVELRTAAAECMSGIDALQEQRLSGHTAGVWSLDFNPDGTLLAGADYGGLTRIWDVKSARASSEVRDAEAVAARRHAAGSPFPAVRYSPAGQYVVHTTWRHAIAALPLRPETTPMPAIAAAAEAQYLAFDRHGAKLAVGWSDARCTIHDAASGQVLREVRREPPSPLRRELVALAPDGETFACVGPDHSVLLYTLSEQTAPTVLGRHHGPITSLAFSGDGRLLATASEDQTTRLFDVALRKEAAVLLGHRARVQCVAFSGDGRIVATASDDRSARLWSTQTGELVLVLRPELGPLLSVALSAHGERLAVGSENDIMLYRIVANRAREILAGHKYAVTSLGFRPGKRELFTASWDNTIVQWNTDAQRTVRSWPTPPGTHPGGLAVCPNGARLAVGLVRYTDREVKAQQAVALWKIADGSAEPMLPPLTGDCAAVAFSPSGELLAAAGRDGTILVWRPATGKVLQRWQETGDAAASLAFLDEDRLLTVHPSRRAVVRDLTSGKPTHQRALADAPASLALSADRTLLAVASPRGRVALYTLPDLSLRIRLDHEHGGPIAAAAFSGDGTLVATSGNDRQVIVWDARDFRRLLLLPKQQGPVFALAFDPGGTRLAISGVEEHVTVWNLDEVRRQLSALGLDWDVKPTSRRP